MHSYERQFPIFKNKTQDFYVKNQSNTRYNTMYNPQATIYFTEGAAGQHHFTPSEPYPSTNNTVYSDIQIGLGKLIIYNETHLYYEHFRSNDSTVLDYFWLIKDPQPTYSSSKVVVLLVISIIFIVLAFLSLLWFYQTIGKKLTDNPEI